MRQARAGAARHTCPRSCRRGAGHDLIVHDSSHPTITHVEFVFHGRNSSYPPACRFLWYNSVIPQPLVPALKRSVRSRNASLSLALEAAVIANAGCEDLAPSG